MIYRIFAQKDTFIANTKKNAIQQTGSNFGGSETLDLYKIAGVSGAIGVNGTASLARILMQFDFSQVAALTASGIAQPGAPTYFLKLRHATTAETLPSSFDVGVLAVSRSWDEGRGIDVETFLDKGFANWDKPTSTTFWTSPGGDFVTTKSASVHFDTGYEDLEVDLSRMVDAWLTGGLVNNGLMVKLTASHESSQDYTDYFIKRFYGRVSNFKDRRPYLEARWDDSLKDDRAVMVWGRTGSLFLYNRVGGQLTNLSIGSNALIVKIADLSGTLLAVTASFVGRTGVYSASFALPTGSYSGSVFFDRWGSGSFAFLTGSFVFKTEGADTDVEPQQYFSSVKNLKDEYDTSEQPRLNVFFKTRSYRPSVVLTASVQQRPTIIRKGYYAIENDATRERVVQFGTGTLETTRLSYDENGNYFNFYVSSLHPGNVYRILLMVDEDGQRQVIDGGHKFKVV